MTALKMDPRHWTTADGHRYTSVPVNPPLIEPARYITCQDVRGRLCYTRGPYTIVREPYCRTTSFTYTVLRDGIEVSGLACYSRLMDAKERVERNAAGLDVVNVA